MFRFTIRDVLWLTVVVALAVGWWIDRREVANAYRAKTDDCELWQRRSEELTVQRDLLGEQLGALRSATRQQQSNTSRNSD